MTHLQILSYGPLVVLSIGGWWRQLEARLWQCPLPDAPAPGEVPLALLVRDVLWRVGAKAGNQFARLEMGVAEDLTIGGDREVIDELLSGLCLLAVQTTPCGNVLVTARRQDTEIALRIADDGIGIPTKRTTEAMDRARELLAILGGRIECAYREGAGSSVTILLPVHTLPWNATIENAMADFARVTREAKAAQPAAAVQPS